MDEIGVEGDCASRNPVDQHPSDGQKRNVGHEVGYAEEGEPGRASVKIDRPTSGGHEGGPTYLTDRIADEEST